MQKRGHQNKKLPSQLRDESRYATPAVPPLLSHLWPVTARGYCLRGDHPLPPTCSSLDFLRRTAPWRVRCGRSLGLAPSPIRCEFLRQLLFHFNAGVRRMSLFSCCIMYHTHKYMSSLFQVGLCYQLEVNVSNQRRGFGVRWLQRATVAVASSPYWNEGMPNQYVSK